MALTNEMAAWQGWRHMTTASSKAPWVNKKKTAPSVKQFNHHAVNRQETDVFVSLFSVLEHAFQVLILSRYAEDI